MTDPQYASQTRLAGFLKLQHENVTFQMSP